MSLATELLDSPTPAAPPVLEALVGVDRFDFRPRQTFCPATITLTNRPATSSATIEGGTLCPDAPGRYVVNVAAGGFSRTYAIVAFAQVFAPSARPALRELVNDARIPLAVLELAASAPPRAVLELLRWRATEAAQPKPGMQTTANGQPVAHGVQALHVCVRCSLGNSPGRAACERCGSRAFSDPGARRYQFAICQCGALLVIPFAAGEASLAYDPEVDEDPRFTKAAIVASGVARGPNRPHAHAAFHRAGWLPPAVDPILGAIGAACSSECREAQATALETAAPAIASTSTLSRSPVSTIGPARPEPPAPTASEWRPT